MGVVWTSSVVPRLSDTMVMLVYMWPLCWQTQWMDRQFPGITCNCPHHPNLAFFLSLRKHIGM